MKKNLYIFALSTLFGVTAAIGSPQAVSAPPSQSQSTSTDAPRATGRRQPDPNQQVKRLAKRLQLTPEQQSQLLPILVQHQEQAKGLRSDTSLTDTDRRAKLRDLRQDSNSQVKAILTDAQKQQYDAMLQHNRSRMHAKRQQGNDGSAS